MKLLDLFRSAGIAAQPLDAGVPALNPTVQSIATDSRTVIPGSLFAALRGTQSDGHDYIAQAVSRGCVAVLAQKENIQRVKLATAPSVPVFFVEDTHRAVAQLYDAWYAHPSQKMRFIAVTGTNGKTSVAWYLKQLFDAAMVPCGFIGTTGWVSRERILHTPGVQSYAHLTTPDPADLYRILSLMQADGVEMVVM